MLQEMVDFYAKSQQGFNYQTTTKATLLLASHTSIKPTYITFIAQRSQKLHALVANAFFYYFTVL